MEYVRTLETLRHLRTHGRMALDGCTAVQDLSEESSSWGQKEERPQAQDQGGANWTCWNREDRKMMV